MKVLLLILLPFLSFGQDKWYKITKNDVVGIIIPQSISGSADGLNQSNAHHKFGEGNPFWDYKTSWKNKYKDFDGGDKSAAFPGSKTWLVFLTDGYHLTRTIDRVAMIATIGLSAYDLSKYRKKDRWKVVAKKIVLSALVNRIAFSIIYNNTGI